MKFRKRPIEVEAYQCREKDPLPPGICTSCALYGTLKIHGSRGDIQIEEGDWIIYGINGCFYPCDPETFKEIYEPVVAQFAEVKNQ